jgi:GNAT superfamily N-acetyltransferase
VATQPEILIAVTPPADDIARRALWAYFDEVASRYYGRSATSDEIATAMKESPSDDLAPPAGLLLIATAGDGDGDVLLGCAGLRLLPERLAEVTRVYVVPAARRQGVGARFMASLEDHARRLGVCALRLDTRHDLTEARRLYTRLGYREVPAFNDDLYAEHWFAKTLN